MNNSFDGLSQRQREILNLLNSDKLLEEEEHFELQLEFQNIEKQVSKQRSINLTNLQKVKINNIIMEGMRHVMYFIKKEFKKFLREEMKFESEEAESLTTKFSKVIEESRLIALNERVSWILYVIENTVHHANRDISELRGAVRDMRDFKTSRINPKLLSYEEAIGDVLSYTKKMLQGHDRKFYYQNKSCLKCNIPIEDWDEGTVSKKGVICAECTGDPTDQLDI